MPRRALALVLFLLLLPLVGSLPVSSASSPSWLQGWRYRLPVIIDNTQNGNDLHDYQVLVVLNNPYYLVAQGYLNATWYYGGSIIDLPDLRFTDSDGVTLLPYWIESDTLLNYQARIWVKVPYIPAKSTKTIYMYFGNPHASSASNGDAVFEFFDDFSHGLNASKWVVHTYSSSTTISVVSSTELYSYYPGVSPPGPYFPVTMLDIHSYYSGGSLVANKSLPDGSYAIVTELRRTNYYGWGELGPGVGFTQNNTDFDNGYGLGWPTAFVASMLYISGDYGPGIFDDVGWIPVQTNSSVYHGASTRYRIEFYYEKNKSFWARFIPTFYGYGQYQYMMAPPSPSSSSRGKGEFDFVVKSSSPPVCKPYYPFLALEEWGADTHAYFYYVFVRKYSPPDPVTYVVSEQLSSAVPPSEWLSGWGYRKPIAIDSGRESSDLTDYQVMVTVDTASLIKQGKMKSDCSDIRFTDSDGTTLLPYWIEDGTANTGNTRIWVKVPYIKARSTKIIYMYYGNPSALSASNGDAVFLFFDDFSGTDLNKTKWTLGYGSYGPASYSVSNGLLSVWSSSPGTWQALHANFAVNYSTGLYKVAVEAKVRIEGTDQFQHYLEFLPTNSSTSLEFGIYEEGTSSYCYYYGTNKYCGLSGVNSPSLLLRYGSSAPVVRLFLNIRNNWHIVRLAKSSAGYCFVVNVDDERRNKLEEGGGCFGGTVPQASLWAPSLLTKSSSKVIFDWVFVRKYSPDPYAFEAYAPETGYVEYVPSGAAVIPVTITIYQLPSTPAWWLLLLMLSLLLLSAAAKGKIPFRVGVPSAFSILFATLLTAKNLPVPALLAILLSLLFAVLLFGKKGKAVPWLK